MATLSAPTLTEILAETRTILGQPSATNSNWTDAELTQYANDAIRRFFQTIIQYSEGQFVKKTTLDITSGQDTVSLPSDFFEVQRLYKINQEDRIMLTYDNHLNKSYRTDGGGNNLNYVPSYYFRGDLIVLRPVPEFTESGALEIEYVAFPETLVSGGDSMGAGISPLFRSVVISYIVYKAKWAESLRGNGINTYGAVKDSLNDEFQAFESAVIERAHAIQFIEPYTNEED